MAYRLGDFILDGDTRELLHDGVEVHLSPKAFDLLNVLVANRARAVSKAELQERLWPSTFVEETNLASLVLEIRRALGDAATTPAFIRTVYAYGYQFIGEVSDIALRAEAARARFWLICEHRQTPLLEGPNVIGRAPDATIRIDFPGVSRYHARIAIACGEAAIDDLGSKNGTLVNGKPIRGARRLADGDEIRVGGAVLAFRIASGASPTATLTRGNPPSTPK